MPLVQVKLVEGAFDEGQKQVIVERLTEAMTGIQGADPHQLTWVVLEEVKSGHWGIGGRPMSSADVCALAATRPVW
jgi:4-oxalocrotonate tautomerase